jgi:hypothetical protein
LILENPRKAALLRGKSMPPGKWRSRRIDERWWGDYRRWDTVDTRFAIVKWKRNIAETRAGNDWRGGPAIVGGIIVRRPRCADNRTRCRWAKRSQGRRTPSSASTHIRWAGFRSREHSTQDHPRANNGFHFPGVVVIVYLYPRISSCATLIVTRFAGILGSLAALGISALGCCDYGASSITAVDAEVILSEK